MHHATELITRTFDEHGICYEVKESDGVSSVEAGFGVRAGPFVTVRFISDDDDNDVAVRVYGLVNRVPAEKRAAVLEACGRLNRAVRFFKFCLDEENSVSLEADLPLETGDEYVGECCFELFVRAMGILENEFHVLGEALFADADSAESKRMEMLRCLQRLRDSPIEITENDLP